MNMPTLSARPPVTANYDFFVAELHRLAQRIASGDVQVDAALNQLLTQLQAHADPRCTGLYVFGSALAQRLAGDLAQDANLYLRRFDVPQIELFNLLGRCMPIVALATQVANNALAQAMQGQAHPIVIDIGIGTGRQVAALMEGLAAQGQLPKQMTVIGVEPAAEALAAARSALFASASRLGTTLRFHGFAACSETLSDVDWQALEALCVTRPVVNAAFALHHIADDAQGHCQRNRVLGRLHALEPLCLVLSEPDVDHLEPRFGARFENCFAHFGAVFQLLDVLDLAQHERDALKVGFFGREIHDILGTPEAQRRERHETAAAWLQRLQATGFEVQPAANGLPASSHAAVLAVKDGQRVVLMAGGESVVSVMVAKPRAASTR